MKYLALIFALSLSCHQALALENLGGLAVSVAPQTPILVPQGSETVNGYFKLKGPYFTVSSLSLSWMGPGQANLVEIDLDSEGSDESVHCVLQGNDLRVLFPSAVDSRGIVVVPQNGAVASTSFGCGSIQVANRNADSFNIPVTVTATALVSGRPNTDIHRTRAITEINVQ